MRHCVKLEWEEKPVCFPSIAGEDDCNTQMYFEFYNESSLKTESYIFCNLIPYIIVLHLCNTDYLIPYLDGLTNLKIWTMRYIRQ